MFAGPKTVFVRPTSKCYFMLKISHLERQQSLRTTATLLLVQVLSLLLSTQSCLPTTELAGYFSVEVWNSLQGLLGAIETATIKNEGRGIWREHNPTTVYPERSRKNERKKHRKRAKDDEERWGRNLRGWQLTPTPK